MDFPGQTREVNAAHNQSASAASKVGPHPHLPFIFFDPASMHKLERTMTARSTQSHNHPLDNLLPPPLPKFKKLIITNPQYLLPWKVALVVMMVLILS
jgi:hypothetical protein